jgi:hypothetical protein
VRYHTNFLRSPKDPFYEANKVENEARRDYYGWVGMPVIRVDGTYEPSATSRSEVESRIVDQFAVESPVQIVVEQSPIEGGQMRVVTTVTAGPDGLAGDFRLRVVAVESHVRNDEYAVSPYNGEVDIHDAMRQFLPSTAGEPVELGVKESKTFTHTYSIGEGWQADQMYAVAFIQDDFDKSIIQAGYSPRPVSSVESPDLAGYGARSAAPNPARGALRIEYTLGRPGHVTATVVDAAGAIVKSLDAGMREMGDGAVTLDVSELPAGAYTVQLASGAWRWSDRVVIVR